MTPVRLCLKSSTLPLSHCRAKHSTTEPLRSQCVRVCVCVCVCVCVLVGGGGQDVITIRTSIMTPLFATVSRVSSAHGVGQGGGGAVVTDAFYLLAQRVLVYACAI